MHSAVLEVVDEAEITSTRRLGVVVVVRALVLADLTPKELPP
jgi:hypothetical protein